MANETALLKIDDALLRNEGFTDSGRRRYCDSVGDYASTLKTRAVFYAEADKAPDLAREVTHDHVRTAAIALAGRRSAPTGLGIAGQVGEYLATAGAGFSAGHLDTGLGILGFGIFMATAVLLLVVRLVRDRSRS